MILKRFCAENFRNIEKCDISFLPGVNLLYGNNAQGKTNAVEGIYIFARGKSFRAKEDKELLFFGKEGFRIYIEYSDGDGEHTLEYAHYGRERRRRKNGYNLKSAKEMIGSFRAVLFYPDDLGIVKDSPEQRRAFLNVAISQCYGIYVDDYSKYKIALENRNHLLKSASKGNYVDARELESWSRSMAEYAAQIYLRRKDYIKKLELYANAVIRDMSSGEESLSLSYKSDIDGELSDARAIKEKYFEVFTRELDREKIVGTSLYGPHRDDMEILINGISARSFGSQGQQRSAALALKLAEGEVCREISGEYPVYLFDDVLSELDEGRREYVLSEVGKKQIIITTCESDFGKIPAEKIIEVTGGEYRGLEG
ncbi:MAG: DNA replication/repair protein RecF [Clostridia bacterium]|nr:DNA replication/repair protein RecF [Clostridia bacterium]